MQYITELLEKNSLDIISYNYEESFGFSQETAVESESGEYKEHKFVIQFNDEKYEILFKNSLVESRYVAMEEELIDETSTIKDNDMFIINKINENNSQVDNLLKVENNRLTNKTEINPELQSFITLLIETANNLGIGVNYNAHYNSSDDANNTYPDRNNNAFFYTYYESLFLDNSELDLFNQYMSIDNKEQETQFLENLNLEENEDETQVTLTQKFKSFKKIMNNQITYDNLPEQLKEVFILPENAIKEFLNNKKESTQVEEEPENYSIIQEMRDFLNLVPSKKRKP